MTLSDLLQKDLNSMPVDDLNRHLEEAAQQAIGHMKDCPEHGPHPEEILSGVEDGEKAEVLLFPNGRLVLRISREGGGKVVGRMCPATVETLVKEGIEVKDVVQALHVFIEQGEMLAMANMPPAEA